MKVRIKNLQTRKKVNLREIRRKVEKILRFLRVQKEVNLTFCSNDLIKKLNAKYFKKNTSTDVIAFPLADKYPDGLLGEVIISTEEVANNAKLYRTSFRRELLLCIIHGLLHLLGYRDKNLAEKRKMQKKEKEVLLFLENDC
ncbi:MAG: rRNA maturation RNase YbeY [Candidatus Omnitrophica bacterium]|nr:rRNA maturation RNase YbeY [Candidatus Omnitrophota bacterium]